MLLMGKLTVSMAIFNSYVKLPESIENTVLMWGVPPLWWFWRTLVYSQRHIREYHIWGPKFEHTHKQFKWTTSLGLVFDPVFGGILFCCADHRCSCTFDSPNGHGKPARPWLKLGCPKISWPSYAIVHLPLCFVAKYHQWLSGGSSSPRPHSFFKSSLKLWTPRRNIIVYGHGSLPITGWWFGTFFFFHSVGNNHPNWLHHFSEG